MYESLLEESSKDFTLYILAMDDRTVEIIEKYPKNKNIIIVPIKNLLTSELEKLREERPGGEFFWTCTSLFLEYCLDNFKLDCCTYLDADIYFYNDPVEAMEIMKDEDVTLLTPHNYHPDFDSTDSSGKYCVQFLPIKNTPKGREILSWWKESCLESCRLDPENGVCGDQKYLEEWQERFSGVAESTHNGVGVAPWNAKSFEILKKKKKIYISEKEKLIFFHFHALRLFKNLDYKPSAGSYYISEAFLYNIYRPYLEKLFQIESQLDLKTDDNIHGMAKPSLKQGKLKKLLKDSFHYINGNKNTLRNIASDTNSFQCPICNNKSSLFIKDVYDDRYGYPESFSLLKCNECGHVHLYASFSESELGKLYSNFYPRSQFDINSYKPNVLKRGVLGSLEGETASAFSWVPKKVKVLDIGCGFGESVGYHSKRGCEAFGIDADENVLRVKDKYGLNLKQGLFNNTSFPDERFDYITLDQVLEHSLSPQKLIQDCVNSLEEGGRVILSLPNYRSIFRKVFGRRWLHWHTPYHLHFFTPESLAKLENDSIKIEEIKIITNSNWFLFQQLHFLNFPSIGKPSKVWSNGRPQILIHLTNIFLKVIHRLKINHLIMRLIDSLNLGDNYIIVMRKS